MLLFVFEKKLYSFLSARPACLVQWYLECFIFSSVMTSAVGQTLSRLLIHVVERNPRLPEVPNHRVLMRFEPGYAVRADPRTHMLQTLPRKWQFLVTLDEYLRPECQQKAKYACINNMDILLINIAADGRFKQWCEIHLLSVQKAPALKKTF